MLQPRRPIELSEQPLPKKHWPGTRGSHDVLTLELTAGLVTAAEAVGAHGICALYGPPGLSKTFTALTLAERLGIPYRYLEPAGGGKKATVIRMLRALGWPHDATNTTDVLIDALVVACAVERVFVIDEADRVGHEGMELVRYLLAQASNHTTFVLVGYRIDRLIAANPALDSRIAWRHEYHALEGEDLIEAMRAYHAAFAPLDEPLLARIGAFSHGEFRRIAQVLAGILARTPAGKAPSVTDRLLDEVFEASGRAWRARAARSTREPAS